MEKALPVYCAQLSGSNRGSAICMLIHCVCIDRKSIKYRGGTRRCAIVKAKYRSYNFVNSSHVLAALLNSCWIRDSWRMIGEQMMGKVRIAGDIWHIRQREKRSNSPLHSVFIEKYFAGTRILRQKSKRDMKIDLHETCIGRRNISPQSARYIQLTTSLNIFLHKVLIISTNVTPAKPEKS